MGDKRPFFYFQFTYLFSNVSTDLYIYKQPCKAAGSETLILHSSRYIFKWPYFKIVFPIENRTGPEIMEGQDSDAFNAGGQSMLVHDSGCRGQQHIAEWSCSIFLINTHSPVQMWQQMVAERLLLRLSVQLRSLPGELGGQAGSQHETAVSHSWRFVSSLKVLEGFQAVVKPSFSPFQLLSPFLRFTLMRIRGQQHVVEKSG